MLIEKICALKEGDKTAFAEIYNLFVGKVYNFTRLYIKDSAEIEDIVQEVFIKLWEMRHDIDEEKNMDGLLFIITRNLIFNYSRKSFNEVVFKEMFLSVAAEPYSTDDHVEANDLKQYIDKLVSQLPPRQQTAFRMSRTLGMSNKQIAEKLNISEKGVERHISLAIKFLKKNLPLFLLFVGKIGPHSGTMGMF